MSQLPDQIYPEKKKSSNLKLVFRNRNCVRMWREKKREKERKNEKCVNNMKSARKKTYFISIIVILKATISIVFIFISFDLLKCAKLAIESEIAGTVS